MARIAEVLDAMRGREPVAVRGEADVELEELREALRPEVAAVERAMRSYAGSTAAIRGGMGKAFVAGVLYERQR